MADALTLLVGLGNPGPEYAGNRHNVGFMALEAIAKRHGFANPKSRFQGITAEGRIDGTKVLGLKPKTYMNNSGDAVAQAVQFYKLAPKDVIVLYDEIDLAPSKIRVKLGGGAAGHNGIRSIAGAIGPDFWRVRIGVGHPGNKDAVHGYVLHDFAKVERVWLEPMLDAIADEIGLVVDGKPELFMTRVAERFAPPRQPRDPDGAG